MDVFDVEEAEDNTWQVNYDSFEDLSYENALNACTSPWRTESPEELCNVDRESDFSVARDENEFSSHAFCGPSQPSKKLIFTSVHLFDRSVEEQSISETLEETCKSLESGYCSSTEHKGLFDPNSSSAPHNLNNWSSWTPCNRENICDRELESSFIPTQNCTAFGNLQERVRLLEEENLKLNMQVSRYKEENSFLREALDRFRFHKSFHGAETVTSACYPESEEDSSSKVKEKRKRRRRIEEPSSLEIQDCRSRLSKEAKKEDPEQDSDNIERSYFQHKLDSLYLKSDGQNNATASPMEFVSIVKDMTEPLMKIDPARAATLTMFIFALALGLFSFQSKGTLSSEFQRSQYLERVLWNNLQDCMKDGCYKGTFLSEMRNGFVGRSQDSPCFEDVDQMMKSYLDASAQPILEETSPAINDELLQTCDYKIANELTDDLTGAYVSSWEQLVELEKFGGGELFSGK